jgi:protein phosphatase
MRRTSNQDSMAVALAEDDGQWFSRGHLFVVADGMGAHAAGELASQIATDNIPHAYQKRRELPPCESIIAAVHDANGRIYAKGQNSVDFHGMGTTCSCLLLLPDGALAAHVGDSRVYRLRGGTIEQLTFDHSLVWEMAAAGQASEDEVPAYVPKNVITRSLGPHPTVKVDLEGPLATMPGDRYLLCSDGLTGPLNPTLIGMVMSSLAPEDSAQTLVDLANLLGGPDNITAVVAEVDNPRANGRSSPSNGQKPASSLSDGRSSQFKGDDLLLIIGEILSAVAVVWAVSRGSTAMAMFGGLTALAIAGIWLAVNRQSRKSDACLSVRGQHGKGPYRHYVCGPSAQNIDMLSDIVRQLEDLEDQREWPFDWSEIHADRHAAYQAIAAGDHTGAVASYSSAVRRLMQAVRAARPEPPGDSDIGLGK